MTNLFSAGRPSSSALAASSRESMRRSLCRIWANNSISLLRIACVSTASHGAKTVNGWNGQRLTGNSSSTMCARDSSNLTGDFFWNSIGARTALHFSHQNCARSLNRKARGSFVGRPCLLRIRLSGRDSISARMLCIFQASTARVFRIARRANRALEGVACCGSG